MAEDQSTPEAALAGFLHAFRALDLDAMMARFAPDATAFAPSEHAVERLGNHEAIRVMFVGIIARVRATGATGLPLHPDDVRTQMLGDVAVVTLHLWGTHLSRRTFVLRRAGEQWQIVHLHGSNAPTPITPSE